MCALVYYIAGVFGEPFVRGMNLDTINALEDAGAWC